MITHLLPYKECIRHAKAALHAATSQSLLWYSDLDVSLQVFYAEDSSGCRVQQ